MGECNHVDKGDVVEGASEVVNAHPEHAILLVGLPHLLLQGRRPARVLITPRACPFVTAPGVAQLIECHKSK